MPRDPDELRDDLKLVWPADIFAREATVLLGKKSFGVETLGWLVEEAFHGPAGRRWLDQVDNVIPKEFPPVLVRRVVSI